MRKNEDVKEFSKAFLLLVERFKNPYKTNEFKNEDEPSENFSIFNSEGKIDVYKVDNHRVLAPRSK